MAFPNRELSQFGSFLLINDTGSTIGIATTATPTIGIGTTRSDVKLTVVGDTTISGVVRASEFYRGNDLLTNATIDRWSSGSGNNIYRLNGNIGIGTTNPIQQIDATQTIKAARFISTVTSGTAPFTVSSDTVVPLLNASFLSGKSAPTGSIVGTTDTQTLTNKTIQSSNITVIGAGIIFSGSISGNVILKAHSNAASNTLTLPSTTGTLVSTGDTGSITSNMIHDETITNTDISPSAAIPYTKLALTGSLVNNDLVNGTIQNSKLANSTISGVSLGSALANLTAGSYISYSSGTTYNGSINITASVNASSAVGSGNNIVARDINGDFVARNIIISNATASQTVQAADFNYTSSIKVNGTVLIDSNKNIVNAGVITATSFNGNGTIPIGGIIMWSGSIVSIPSSWSICNGSNGTPDLRNRFVVGAGGNYSVAGIGGTTDSVVVSHTHGYTYRSTETISQGVISAEIVGSDVTTSGITSSTGVSGTNQNLPPYYALAFIMRIS